MTTVAAAAGVSLARERVDASRIRLVGAVAVLALWLGAAMLTAAVVAPAAFAVLPSRALAGALVGRVLPAVFVAGIGAGAAAAVLAPGAMRFARARVALPAAAALLCAAAQFGVAPRIRALRADLGPTVEAVDPRDARRVAFGRLHAASVLLMGAAGVAAAGALAANALAARAVR